MILEIGKVIENVPKKKKKNCKERPQAMVIRISSPSMIGNKTILFLLQNLSSASCNMYTLSIVFLIKNVSIFPTLFVSSHIINEKIIGSSHNKSNCFFTPQYLLYLCINSNMECLHTFMLG